MLEKRSHTSGINFTDVMQADFVLWFRSRVLLRKDQISNPWWPHTLIYATHRVYKPFEIFARAQSKGFFADISQLLGVEDRAEFDLVMAYLEIRRRLTYGYPSGSGTR
jgi:hypothetical protein